MRQAVDIDTEIAKMRNARREREGLSVVPEPETTETSGVAGHR